MATALTPIPASIAAFIRAPQLQLVRSTNSLKALKVAGRIHASLSAAAPLSAAKPDDLVASILSKVCAFLFFFWLNILWKLFNNWDFFFFFSINGDWICSCIPFLLNLCAGFYGIWFCGSLFDLK